MSERHGEQQRNYFYQRQSRFKTSHQDCDIYPSTQIQIRKVGKAGSLSNYFQVVIAGRKEENAFVQKLALCAVAK